MFEKYKTFSYDFAGRPLVIETGKMAGLANGSVLVRYGDTAVLCCATASERPRDGIDFLPLSIDFEERLYAVGRIPGSYLKREGRPSEKAILTSRVIDRPVRPLFPKDLRNDVVLSLLVLAVDHDASPEIAAMVGASIALSISDIPWNGPIGGVFVGLTEEEGLIINPTAEQRDRSCLELTVAGTKQKVVMIEAGAAEVPDDKMFEAIMFAHEEIKKVCDFIETIVAEVGKPKFEYPSAEIDHDLFDAVYNFCAEDVKVALDTDDKNIRDARMAPITEAVYNKFDEGNDEMHVVLDEVLYKVQKQIVRRWLLDEQKRVDGRRMDQIRPLAAEVHLFNRDHGSGMFTRGQTQVLNVATLGSISDVQMLDGISEEETKRYMHHYN
ncbi:MAG: polyribonucleotide nucleotidyltransferase, partial [Clostridia bacterium]|nr:polyribonucleotide nucleotidyltransferase [Clostridia bacterium]